MLLDPCVIRTGQLLDKFEAVGLNLCYIIELREQQLLEAVTKCHLEDQGDFGAGECPGVFLSSLNQHPCPGWFCGLKMGGNLLQHGQASALLAHNSC